MFFQSSRSHQPRVIALALLVGITGILASGQRARAEVGKITTVHEFSPPYPEAALVRGSDGAYYGTTYYGGNGFGSIYKITAAGVFATVYGFHESDGANPAAGLVQTSDGSFYGTTYAGGASGLGTVFCLTSSGVFSVLHSFGGGSDGANPSCVLLPASDGFFYGTTSDNSIVANGTVFRIAPSGALTTIYHFDVTHGANPQCGLIVGADGAFYGTAPYGGSHSEGTAYRVTADGTVTTLYNFGSADGTNPRGRLVLGSDGNYYGTAFAGAGADDNGSIYVITPSGSFAQLHNFNGNDGSGPACELVPGGDGNFYGTTLAGGAHGLGTVFRISPAGGIAGNFMSLFSFLGDGRGDSPSAGLVPDGNGLLYGATRGSFSGAGSNDPGTVFNISLSGALTTLHQFLLDGASPVADSLVQGADGNVYGTTSGGGDLGSGALFRVTPAGEFASLHSFDPNTGSAPQSNPIRGSDDNFYGTTSLGGGASQGTIYRFSPASGAYVLVHSFQSSEGEAPIAGLIQAGDGSFYGVTESGGTANRGTIFKLASSTLTTLQSFASEGSVGEVPVTPLAQGSDGNFYGATTLGSANSLGALFMLPASGAAVREHPFSTAAGYRPANGLVQAGDGYFYGATVKGGDHDNGTVYRFNSAGAFDILHSFEDLDGINPAGGRLVPAGDGSFYGVTTGGGAHGQGSIYQIKPDGTLTTLHSFNDTDGSLPAGGIMRASDGSFYGTTAGGANGLGTVYHFTLPPVISSALSATAYAGKAFSYQIAATNTPTSYGEANLPAGLSINLSTGKISGTPRTAGTYTPLIAAFNAGGSGSAKLTLTVNPGSPVITSTLSASGQTGKAFSYQITATNSPTSYGESGIPSGLTINQTTGKISGTPTKTGTYSVTIAAFNGAGSGSAKLTLTITQGPPVITSALSATATVGKAFSYQITATNTPTKYGESGVPGGLTINQTTGKISGTPATAGTYTVTVAAFNSSGSGSAKLTLTVH